MAAQDELQALKNEVASLELVIGYLAKKANIQTAELNTFADSVIASIPENRKAATRDCLSRLVKTYEALA